MNLRLGITIGDPAGIGPEVVLKALSSLTRAAPPRHTFVIFAPESFLNEASRRVGSRLSFCRLERIPDRLPPGLFCFDRGYHFNRARPGKPDRSSARATLDALRDVILEACADRLDAVATAPVSKIVLREKTGQSFVGQTEFIARVAGVDSVAMAFFSRRLKVVLLTTHLPLRRAIRVNDPELLASKVDLFVDGLARLGLGRPRIAVAGLNPHASENGLFGDEEQRWIRPAIDAYRRRNRRVELSGPYSPDTVFYRAIAGEFDGVVALYHDQGLIPIKTLGPGQAANVTLGLPFIRTSPDHGTAYDIAGKGVSDASGMAQSIEWAIRLTKKSP